MYLRLIFDFFANRDESTARCVVWPWWHSIILSTGGTNQHFELRADKFFFERVSSDRDKEVLKNKIKIVPFCAAQGKFC